MKQNDDNTITGNPKSKDKDAEMEKQNLPYPKSVFFIISNEFCERFSFYGMRTILIFYFKFILDFEDSFATLIYHVFVMACYFTPIFGAILADSFLGKYWTILSISIVYAIGNILLSIASVQGTSWASFLGLALIAIGTGGIKPCVSAFGGDQFLPGQELQLQQFFSWFYIAINSGSLVSTFLTPIFRQDIHCLGRQDCYPLAFGVPALLMIVALVLFIMGRFITGYIIHPPSKDNVVISTCQCVGRAIYRKITSSEKRNHWVEYADDKYDRKTINEVKCLMRILFLYIPLPIFWALFDQQASRWTLQALQMNGKIGSWTVKPDQIQVINPFLVVFLIPIFQYFVYPLIAKFKINTPLRRMVLGMILASISFGVCAYFQIKIENSEPQPMWNEHNHLALINGAENDATFANITLKPNEIRVLANQPRNDLESNFNISLEDGKSLILYYQNQKPNIIPLIFDDILIKPEKGGSLFFTVFDLENFKSGTVFQVKDQKIPSILLNDSTTIGYSNPFEIDVAGKSIQLTIGNFSKEYPNLGQGATYLQLIKGDLLQGFNLTVENIVEENRYSVFLQIIPYFIMTSAEILFSITGLEFSYSQAPQSMKSVLQAAWLLTVAFGNLIVAAVADTKLFTKQSYEFWFFGGLMFIDSLIFALMAKFYVPFKPDENGHLDGDDLTTSSNNKKKNDEYSMEPINGGSGNGRSISE